ncbi:MFS transporter [Rubrivirga sp. IMCC45206]|uniref:MFS transporter n=1 Tax=Rubrivirga sp. IMCC45206 TaxID=3391614 RepID=UPI0039900069
MTSQRGDKKAIWAWSLYDFANSSFTTLVVTFIYGTYFTGYMVLSPDAAGVAVPDGELGTVLWSRAVTITAILVALLSPVLGAFADRGGARKSFLLAMTVICVVGTVGLYAAEPGQVMQALFWFVAANVAFETAQVFYNAYLPDIARPDQIGRVSGYGWALGYVGGLLCLGIALVVFVNPEVAPFGLDKALGEHVRATNLLVAGWFAVFSIPTFLVLREVQVESRPPLGTLVKESFGELAETARELRRYRQIVRLLVARIFYNDGLVTLIAFGGIYAQGTLGFEIGEVLLFGIVLNVAAMIGALGFGFLDDRIGGRPVLFMSLALLIVAAMLAVSTESRTVFWVSGVLVGLAIGPNQSASRSLLGRFVPDDKETEFYGFFAFSGKATAFIGPFLLGVLTQAFGSQRIGISVVLVLFVIGAALLTRVDEAEGIALSGRPST